MRAELKTISAATAANAKGLLCAIEPENAAASAEAILAEAGVPDILVCAWGPFDRRPLDETGAEQWLASVGANLIFPGILVSKSLPSMKRNSFGRVLLFGGTNTDTVRGYRTTAVYSAAKTALGVLAKSVAAEYGEWGITCNVICPGLAETEYNNAAVQEYNAKKRGKRPPLLPQDIAEAACALIENSAVNGAVVRVDQGVSV